jgi:hypothetical protein
MVLNVMHLSSVEHQQSNRKQVLCLRQGTKPWTPSVLSTTDFIKLNHVTSSILTLAFCYPLITSSIPTLAFSYPLMKHLHIAMDTALLVDVLQRPQH